MQCLQLLQQERMENLIRLFHYPAEMVPADRELEQIQIAASLTELNRLFGPFTEPRIPETPRLLHQFEVQGVTSRYWADRPRFFQVVYNTIFAKLGEGSLVFRVVVYDHRLQLRSIGFALPAEVPGSTAKKDEIDNHMSRFFHELQQQSGE